MSTHRRTGPAVPGGLLAGLPLVLAFALGGSVPPPVVFAADGFPVCDAAGDQDAPSITRASDLATWIAWRDGRRSDTTVRTDLYVARLPAIVAVPDANPGAASFAPAADGFPACQSGAAGAPVAVRTDSGGVLVVWADDRAGGRGIYAQRLRDDGSRYPGWPADGRRITADVLDLTLAACTDGAGGAYIGRKSPFMPEIQRIAVTRITKTGDFAPGWLESGVVIGNDEIVQGVTLAPDPSGGFVYTIRTYFNGGAGDLQTGRAGRVSATGALGPGVSLTGWRSHGVAPGIVGSIAAADGAGGLFAAWNDAPGPVFYGQHWSAAGAPQWPDSLPAPHMDALGSDGAGGAYFVGREKQNLNRLSILRRDASGAPAPFWNPAGTLLAEPIALAHVGAILGNGAFVYWSEDRGTGSGFDIRGTSVRANGRLAPFWLGGGDPLCDAAGNQTNVVGAAGSQVLAWVDERNLATTRKDLWATYVLGPIGGAGVAPGGGEAPSALRIRALFPNPATDELRVSLAPGGAGPLRVHLVDLRGRVVLRHTIVPDGDAVTVVLTTRGLPAGLYWVRAVQGKDTARARVTVLR